MKAEVDGTNDYTALTTDTPLPSFTIAAIPEEGAKTTVYATVQDKTITYGDAVGEVTVNYTDSTGTAVTTD